MNDFMQRGLAAAKARQPEQAALWFGKAAESNPSDLQARSWYGQALCAIGERLRGTAELCSAAGIMLTTDGMFDKALDVIAQLQGWGDFASALELCRQAATLQRDHARAQQMLASTCGQLNLPDEGLAACRASMALRPDPMLTVLEASLEADAKRAEAAHAILTRFLGTRPGPREQFRAHKEMGRVLDRMAAYEEAFTHLQAAARLVPGLPEFQRIDRKLMPAMIAANRAAFDRDVLSRWSGEAFGDRPAPIFLIGFFRSGTTLMQEVLASHPDVFVADEAQLVFDVQQDLLKMVPSPGHPAAKLRALDAGQVRRLRDRYWVQARARYGDAIDKPVFVDKFTMNTVDLGLINAVFPDAKLIFMVRDPRDVCLSCFAQLMVPSPATVHLAGWSDTAAFYAIVMDWWRHIRERLSLDWIEIRYEDVVSDFGGSTGRVLDFLGLDRRDDLIDFHKQAASKFIASPSRNQVTQPLYASSLERWRAYEAHFRPIGERLEPFVTAFGYQ